MKVKIFQNRVAYDETHPAALEEEMNKWLENNANIEIVDIRFSTVYYPSGPVGGGGSSGIALILYKEN